MASPIKLIVIDSFCGAGGVTEGFHRAKLNGEYCVSVVIGINHDAKAIESHACNHPETYHFVEDFRSLDPKKLLYILEQAKQACPDAKVMFWMSAECTHHSKAKGGESRDADSRSLPEHAYKYIEILNPDIIGVENVTEFLDWGPLMEKTKKDRKGNVKIIHVPIPERKGEYYNAWIRKIQSYGYQYDFDKLNAANYGAFTSRTRYFGFFSKEADFIAFPEETHSKDGKGGKKKWNAVKDVLDFSDEGTSIFGRKEPLVENTLDRVESGLIKFVAGGKDKWMLKYNSVNGCTGKHNPPSVDEPCPVVSCQNRLGIFQAKFLSKYYGGKPEHKNISIEGPAHTIKTKDCHALVQCDFLSAYYGNGHNHSVNDPSPTLTTKDRCALVKPVFLCSYNFKDEAKSTDAPCPTLLTKDRFAVVNPQFLVNSYSGGGKTGSIENPCPVISTVPKQNLIKCRFIDQQYGQSKAASVEAPIGSLTANPKYNVVGCDWLMNTNFSNIGSSLDSPAPVITANRKHHYLVNPQFDSVGWGIDRPCFTLIARMDKRPPGIVTTSSDLSDLPSFVKIVGNTVIYEIYDTDSPKTKEIKEFMALYGITDIKMRMLRVDELLRIMGFGDHYILKGTLAERKKFIGNAVECTQSRVIAEAIAQAISKYLARAA
jgi:Site-specific DNA methylase